MKIIFVCVAILCLSTIVAKSDVAQVGGQVNRVPTDLEVSIALYSHTDQRYVANTVVDSDTNEFRLENVPIDHYSLSVALPGYMIHFLDTEVEEEVLDDTERSKLYGLFESYSQCVRQLDLDGILDLALDGEAGALRDIVSTVLNHFEEGTFDAKAWFVSGGPKLAVVAYHATVETKTDAEGRPPGVNAKRCFDSLLYVKKSSDTWRISSERLLPTARLGGFEDTPFYNWYPSLPGVSFPPFEYVNSPEFGNIVVSTEKAQVQLNVTLPATAIQRAVDSAAVAKERYRVHTENDRGRASKKEHPTAVNEE